MVVDISASDADLGMYTGLYYIASQLATVAGPTGTSSSRAGGLRFDLCGDAGVLRVGDFVHAGGDEGGGETSSQQSAVSG
jgi:hypothetical protein